jgi:hypothetical protein
MVVWQRKAEGPIHGLLDSDAWSHKDFSCFKAVVTQLQR